MDDKTRHPGGRPPKGYTTRTKAITVRLEPYVYDEMRLTCIKLGITPTDAIREGLRMFLQATKAVRL